MQYAVKKESWWWYLPKSVTRKMTGVRRNVLDAFYSSVYQSGGEDEQSYPGEYQDRIGYIADSARGLIFEAFSGG